MNVCFIPAKAQSRRCPNKNFRIWDGKPLWGHTLQTALATNRFDRVFVSSDKYPLDAPPRSYEAIVGGWAWLQRSGEQLNPDWSATQVTLSHIEELGLDDDALVAQMLPTCPFVRPETVARAWDYWTGRDTDATLVSVYPLKHVRSLNANGWVRPGQLHPYDHHGLVRSTGGFQFGKVSTLRPLGGFWTGKTLAFELSAAEAIDIDTEDDWEFAQQVRFGWQAQQC